MVFYILILLSGMSSSVKSRLEQERKLLESFQRKALKSFPLTLCYVTHE